MENLDKPLDAWPGISTAPRLELTEELATSWLSISGWAFFLAVLLYFGAGISAFFAVMMLENSPLGAFIPFGLAMLLLMPALLLSRFRQNLKKSLYHESAEKLETSFRAFRQFYLFAGIATIFVTVLSLGFFGYSMYKIANAPEYDPSEIPYSE